MQTQSIVVPGQALLMQLELPQSLVLLVASRASVLHQVEAGLGGVVTQRAVVDAQLWAVGAVLLLQVLRDRGKQWLDGNQALVNICHHLTDYYF